jgi:hypothetical protein
MMGLLEESFVSGCVLLKKLTKLIVALFSFVLLCSALFPSTIFGAGFACCHSKSKRS